MSIYYTQLLDVLRAAGCKVAESSITNGWQKRARSSGGFPSAPLAVAWHHTASNTSPANDLSYMINGSSDAPIGNVLLDRTGTYWPIAAGAANTQGKGGPRTFSRGTIPLDQGNTRAFAIEAANNGVGEQWPQAQIDAYFAGSNAINAMLGNLPSDIMSHAISDGAGWTDRKIDPATAAAVQGPWRPASQNSSGTWRLSDMKAECTRRAGSGPAPKPPDPTPDPPNPGPTPKEADMATVILHVVDCNAQFIGQGPLLADGTVHNLFITWFGPGPEGNPFLSDHAAAPDTIHQTITMDTIKRDLVYLGNPEDIEDSAGPWGAGDFYRVVRS